MDKMLKNNILYILIVIIAIVGGIYLVYATGMQTYENFNEITTKNGELKDKKQQLERIALSKAKKQNNTEERKATKVIYEVLGQQFSSEASFGIMFDNIISNITSTGLRIRSIDYNYSPAEDKVLEANVPGYNACELSFVTVGSYSQLQNFLKNIAKEDYLTSIQELNLEPYEKDKSVLIASFKIRLYTKTI